MPRGLSWTADLGDAEHEAACRWLTFMARVTRTARQAESDGLANGSTLGYATERPGRIVRWRRQAMWRRRGEVGGVARGHLGNPRRPAGQPSLARIGRVLSADATPSAGMAGFLGAVAVVVAFHGLFVGSMWKVTHERWLQSPAAMAITLAHATIGSVGSVWLSRIMPRVLSTRFTDGWLSATTVSFFCTVATSSWLGYTAFELLPNYERLTGVTLGYVGLFLVIPASMYFWRLGRSFSW